MREAWTGCGCTMEKCWSKLVLSLVCFINADSSVEIASVLRQLFFSFCLECCLCESMVAAKNALTWIEQQAILQLLDEQLTAKGLLPPRLFSVTYAFESSVPPRVAQIPIHQGDDPDTVAARFVQQYAGMIWPKIEQTKAELSAVIRARI